MGTLQVLIVDDSSLVRNIVKQTVVESFPGVQAAVANDGAQARKMLSEGHFDLVLCDWEMPALNGNELLRWLREESSCQKTPFIMITANVNKDNILEVMKLGVAGYIAKPFTSEAICQKVRPVLKSIGWIEPQSAGSNLDLFSRRKT